MGSVVSSDTIKSKGTKLLDIISNKVCGDDLCLNTLIMYKKASLTFNSISDFTASPFFTSGIGTEDDPYTISDITFVFTDEQKTMGEVIVIDGVDSSGQYVKLKNISIYGAETGIYIKNSSRITVENFNSKYTKVPIKVIGSSYLVIDRLYAVDPNYGVFFDRRTNAQNTHHNTIQNSFVKNSSRESFYVFGNYTTIKNNNIDLSQSRSIFFLSPFYGSVLSNNLITNSNMEAIHILGHKNSDTIPQIGMKVEGSQNIFIINNEIIGQNEDGIELQEGVIRSYVINNYIHDSNDGQNGISNGHINSIELFRYSNYNIIAYNTIEHMKGDTNSRGTSGNGIVMSENSNFNVIYSNKIIDIPGKKINLDLYGSIGNVVYNNELTDGL